MLSYPKSKLHTLGFGAFRLFRFWSLFRLSWVYHHHSISCHCFIFSLASFEPNRAEYECEKQTMRFHIYFNISAPSLANKDKNNSHFMFLPARSCSAALQIIVKCSRNQFPFCFHSLGVKSSL